MNAELIFASFSLALFCWWFLDQQLRAFTPWPNSQIKRHLAFSRRPLFGLIFRPLILATVWTLSFYFCSAFSAGSVCMFGLILFCFSRWTLKFHTAVLTILALGLFGFGIQSFLQSSSQFANQLQEYSFLFHLSDNYLMGALIGFAIGALIRLAFRLPGVSYWAAGSLLLAGVLSLGSAWGFILGEMFVDHCEVFFSFENIKYRKRGLFGLVTTVLFLVLTNPIEGLMLSWMNGEFSSQLRIAQFSGLVFLFLLAESGVTLLLLSKKNL